MKRITGFLIFNAAIVCGLLFAMRFAILYIVRTRWGESPHYISLFAGSAARFGGDAAAVAVVLCVTLLLARVSPRLAVLVAGAANAAFILLGAVNIFVAPLYAQPVTVNLMKYAGFTDVRALFSVMTYMEQRDILVMMAAAAVAILALILPLFAVRPGRLSSWQARIAAFMALILLCAPLLSLLPNSDRKPGQSANAAWWLLRSAGRAVRQEDHPGGPPDLKAPYEMSAEPAPAITSPERIRTAGIRNVIMIVLESVGGHYLDLENNPELTPNLAALSRMGAYFPNAYAQMPSSPVAMYTMLSSIYPPMSTRTVPEVAENLPIPLLTEELAKTGMRNGIFFSAGWKYAGYIDYLARNRDNHVQDSMDRADCASPLLGDPARVSRAGSEAVATRDLCTFHSMQSWADTDKSPFFALLWTGQTHYPYYVEDEAGEPEPGTAEGKARYMRNIALSDSQIGAMVDWLKASGRFEDTLLVVVGDHGEAFNQHDNQVHGGDIYDESIRVPLLFINPRLFSGSVRKDAVGQIDIASTVLGALGRPLPPSFKGIDLTGTATRKRTFFAVPWVNPSMGYVEDGKKYNYDIETGVLQAFDLRTNPGEDATQALSLPPEEQRQVIGRIWNWKQAVDQEMKDRGAID